MRNNAQRAIYFQDCLPADRDSMGTDISLGLQTMVATAFKEWLVRRGMNNTSFFLKNKDKAQKSAVVKPAPKKKKTKKKSKKSNKKTSKKYEVSKVV